MLKGMVCVGLVGAALAAGGQARKTAGTTAAAAARTVGERRAAAAFEEAKAKGPLALHVFLVRMPKGADLHMHLSGAVYAETFLRDAAEDGMCVDPVKLRFVSGSGGKAAPGGKAGANGTGCGAGSEPVADAFKDQHLYDGLVDSFSMRGFVPTPGRTGHDQFFDTFERFGGTNRRHKGAWLDEVASRAARQNEQYLEVMETPGFSRALALSKALGWPVEAKPATTADRSEPEDGGGASRAELAALREKLLADKGFREEIAANREELAGYLAERAKMERCGSSASTVTGGEAAKACGVEIRFLYQILRANAPQQVFAQTLLGFEVADAEAATGEPKVVGVNFVQPEDNYVAMSEYHRQMLMLDYLHSVYPRVRISLHAGELAPGMVPPAGLGFHIREAVELGHAERIGHGVDVMYERDARGLLQEMKEKGVMVEVNLTSNDGILGVSGNRHSLPAYVGAGVPVALSTDDEGVSRIDLTHEYVRAATEFGLGYLALKKMARTGLEHSFLPGESLWEDGAAFTRMKGACAGARAEEARGACAALLSGSAKAKQEWELEGRFAAFEGAL